MTLNLFEQTKQINEYHQEFWKARSLAKILEYIDYRNFLKVIEKAKIACKNSGYTIKEHFGDVNEPQKSRNQYGETQGQMIDDIKLSRYACYLIVQNADPSKNIVALGQSYFAIQTRRQELNDQYSSDNQRVVLRNEMKIRNKKLASTASRAGVKDYANFTDAGYMGLYGGLKQKDIHTNKQLNPNDAILDYMDSEELAANLFRTTQAESKIRREEIKGQDNASLAHYEIGKKVRKTIQEIGGTMPENLPTVENIKITEKKLKGKARTLL